MITNEKLWNITNLYIIELEREKGVALDRKHPQKWEDTIKKKPLTGIRGKLEDVPQGIRRKG